MKIHDVTITISDGMPVYPGDPDVSIRRVTRLEDGAPFNLSLLTMGSHTGTHIDPPYHLMNDGKKADEIPLDALIGPVLVVQAGPEGVDRALLTHAGLSGWSRVIFKTAGAAPVAGEGCPDGYTCIAPDAAGYLAGLGLKLVGVDRQSVEEPGDSDGPVHLMLLTAGIIILEGLDLSGISPGPYEIVCLPLKIKDGDGAPARVILRELEPGGDF